MNDARPKRIVLLILVIVWAIAGILEAVINHRGAGYVAYTVGHGLLTTFLGLLWVQYDSTERGYPLSKALKVMVCLFGAIAIPYYLLRTRGLGGGVIGIGKAMLFGCALLIVFAVTEYSAERVLP